MVTGEEVIGGWLRNNEENKSLLSQQTKVDVILSSDYKVHGGGVVTIKQMSNIYKFAVDLQY